MVEKFTRMECDFTCIEGEFTFKKEPNGMWFLWKVSLPEWKASLPEQRFTLKVVCHEIFDLQFFSWFKPIWAPDKQAKKVFSNSVSILPRYSITKFEKFDSAVYMTTESKF